MTERDNLPTVTTKKAVAVLSEQRGSLVGRGLAVLSKDNDALYRQARMVFDRQMIACGPQYRRATHYPALSSAFKIFQKLANENFSKAYYPLSILYGGKRDIEKNPDLAQHFAHLAFDWCFENRTKQDVELWADLGSMYLKGHGVEINYTEAIKWFRLAAEQGHAEAQMRTSNMYARGQGVEKNDEVAKKWKRLAADQGHVEAQFYLALMYADVEMNCEDGVKWYRKAADQGSVHAQIQLAHIYREWGDGVLHDYEEAVKWFRMATEGGYEHAYSSLEDMYEEGQAVAPSDEQTACWHRKCAEQGNTEAQWRLGNMYWEGRGVPEDDEEAVKWISLAADQGNRNAQWSLGILYRDGRAGFHQDYEKAGKFFLLSAEQGNGRSEYALSQMYKNGQGVLQDYEEVAKRVAERDATARAASTMRSKRLIMTKKKLAALGDADAQKFLQKSNIDWKE